MRRGKSDFDFGLFLILNVCILVVVIGEGKNFCILVYFVEFFILYLIICMFEFEDNIGFLLFYFMEIDVLIIVFKDFKLLKVF